MILKLRTADDCERLIEVSYKRPPQYYVTVLRYPLPPIRDFLREFDPPKTVPLRTVQRQYEYVCRLGQEMYEYREVLI